MLIWRSNIPPYYGEACPPTTCSCQPASFRFLLNTHLSHIDHSSSPDITSNPIESRQPTLSAFILSQQNTPILPQLLSNLPTIQLISGIHAPVRSLMVHDLEGRRPHFLVVFVGNCQGFGICSLFATLLRRRLLPAFPGILDRSSSQSQIFLTLGQRVGLDCSVELCDESGLSVNHACRPNPYRRRNYGRGRSSDSVMFIDPELK